jgi:SAM-dependent methyltransferase
LGYLAKLYRATMDDAYESAYRAIIPTSGKVLDCGAGGGHAIRRLSAKGCEAQLVGVEWDPAWVEVAQSRGLDVREGDLNERLPFANGSFQGVLGLSVLEHILKPCHFIREAHRILEPGGRLVLLTPNIATWFTALNILRGRMPSTGPHPDSNALHALNDYAVKPEIQLATEGDTPAHRHLVVFSYSALKAYLDLAGFSRVEGRGFGYYPFPRLLQPMLERLDPWHCHQMVFVATK